MISDRWIIYPEGPDLRKVELDVGDRERKALPALNAKQFRESNVSRD